MDTVMATALDEPRFKLVDADVPMPRAWAPLLVPRADIEAAVERLQDLGPGVRRAMEVIHPEATAPGLGLAPGMAFSVNVLNPGETVTVSRDNANRVEFCIRGSGKAVVGGRTLQPSKWDTWNTPSMARREYRCEGSEPFAWFSYSNVPLLQKLGIHYSDEGDIRPARKPSEQEEGERKYVRENAPDIDVLGEGARFRGYEYLTDIEVSENKALIWPWKEVSQHLSQEQGDGKRTIMLMYNPATQRRNGTTHSFFATLSSWPPGKERPVPARGHKHSSFACNYHFKGRGSSVVDGQRIEWEAGDLLLSAPSWSEHAHGASVEGSAILTVQDHPFQIGTESLIWQERIDGPILTLGSEAGQTGYVGPRLKGG